MISLIGTYPGGVEVGAVASTEDGPLLELGSDSVPIVIELGSGSAACHAVGARGDAAAIRSLRNATLNIASGRNFLAPGLAVGAIDGVTWNLTGHAYTFSASRENSILDSTFGSGDVDYATITMRLANVEEDDDRYALTLDGFRIVVRSTTSEVEMYGCAVGASCEGPSILYVLLAEEASLYFNGSTITDSELWFESVDYAAGSTVYQGSAGGRTYSAEDRNVWSFVRAAGNPYWLGKNTTFAIAPATGGANYPDSGLIRAAYAGPYDVSDPSWYGMKVETGETGCEGTTFHFDNGRRAADDETGLWILVGYEGTTLELASFQEGATLELAAGVARTAETAVRLCASTVATELLDALTLRAPGDGPGFYWLGDSVTLTVAGGRNFAVGVEGSTNLVYGCDGPTLRLLSVPSGDYCSLSSELVDYGSYQIHLVKAGGVANHHDIRDASGRLNLAAAAADAGGQAFVVDTGAAPAVDYHMAGGSATTLTVAAASVGNHSVRLYGAGTLTLAGSIVLAGDVRSPLYVADTAALTLDAGFTLDADGNDLDYFVEDTGTAELALGGFDPPATATGIAVYWPSLQAAISAKGTGSPFTSTVTGLFAYSYGNTAARPQQATKRTDGAYALGCETTTAHSLYVAFGKDYTATTPMLIAFALDATGSSLVDDGSALPAVYSDYSNAYFGALVNGSAPTNRRTYSVTGSSAVAAGYVSATLGFPSSNRYYLGGAATFMVGVSAGDTPFSGIVPYAYTLADEVEPPVLRITSGGTSGSPFDDLGAGGLAFDAKAVSVQSGTPGTVYASLVRAGTSCPIRTCLPIRIFPEQAADGTSPRTVTITDANGETATATLAWYHATASGLQFRGADGSTFYSYGDLSAGTNAPTIAAGASSATFAVKPADISIFASGILRFFGVLPASLAAAGDLATSDDDSGASPSANEILVSSTGSYRTYPRISGDGSAFVSSADVDLYDVTTPPVGSFTQGSSYFDASTTFVSASHTLYLASDLGTEEGEHSIRIALSDPTDFACTYSLVDGSTTSSPASVVDHGDGTCTVTFTQSGADGGYADGDLCVVNVAVRTHRSLEHYYFGSRQAATLTLTEEATLLTASGSVAATPASVTLAMILPPIVLAGIRCGAAGADLADIGGLGWSGGVEADVAPLGDGVHTISFVTVGQLGGGDAVTLNYTADASIDAMDGHGAVTTADGLTAAPAFVLTGAGDSGVLTNYRFTLGYSGERWNCQDFQLDLRCGVTDTYAGTHAYHRNDDGTPIDYDSIDTDGEPDYDTISTPSRLQFNVRDPRRRHIRFDTIIATDFAAAEEAETQASVFPSARNTIRANAELTPNWCWTGDPAVIFPSSSQYNIVVSPALDYQAFLVDGCHEGSQTLLYAGFKVYVGEDSDPSTPDDLRSAGISLSTLADGRYCLTGVPAATDGGAWRASRTSLLGTRSGCEGVAAAIFAAADSVCGLVDDAAIATLLDADEPAELNRYHAITAAVHSNASAGAKQTAFDNYSDAFDDALAVLREAEVDSDLIRDARYAFQALSYEFPRWLNAAATPARSDITGTGNPVIFLGGTSVVGGQPPQALLISIAPGTALTTLRLAVYFRSDADDDGDNDIRHSDSQNLPRQGCAADLVTIDYANVGTAHGAFQTLTIGNWILTVDVATGDLKVDQIVSYSDDDGTPRNIVGNYRFRVPVTGTDSAVDSTVVATGIDPTHI